MECATETARAPRSATLMVHLLGRCNLTCQHCYMGGAPTRRELLPADLVIRALGECASLDIGTLFLTGGEPLLYRGLADVLLAAARDPGLRITVCTNATLVRQRHATLLREVGARANISVDGEPAFHDRFRRLEGAFALTERGIRTLLDAGIEVEIVMTVSRGNRHSVAGMVEWAAERGVVELRVQPLLRLGRGLEIADQCLTTPQLNELLLELSDLTNRYRTRNFKCSVVGTSKRFLLAHPCGAYVCNGLGCHRRVAREIKKVVVREDGTILPEITNLSHEFAIGHITDGPLSLQLRRFIEGDGYARFDDLCRRTYADVLPDWDSPVVPWDQIVAERSHTRFDHAPSANVASDVDCSLGSCSGGVASRTNRTESETTL